VTGFRKFHMSQQTARSWHGPSILRFQNFPGKITRMFHTPAISNINFRMFQFFTNLFRAQPEPRDHIVRRHA
jgi:hypothetical protein